MKLVITASQRKDFPLVWHSRNHEAVRYGQRCRILSISDLKARFEFLDGFQTVGFRCWAKRPKNLKP